MSSRAAHTSRQTGSPHEAGEGRSRPQPKGESSAEQVGHGACERATAPSAVGAAGRAEEPRIVLVTGLGGAGRSTAAAATAVAAARAGARTVLLTDAGHIDGSHIDVPGLTVSRIDGAYAFRARAHAFQARLSSLFDLLGADPLDPEEFTELPGAHSFALLHALGEAASEHADTVDTVVADLPPVPQAITLLALPEQLRRYLARLLPPERQAARALRPVLAQLAGVPMPAQWLYETAARWDGELAAVQGLIESAATTVRLVVEPGPHTAERLRDARTGLALFGHRVECVLANRILPTDSADPFLARLSGCQQQHLKALHDEAAAGTQVHELPHLGHAPHSADDLMGLGVPAPGVVQDGEERRTRAGGVAGRGTRSSAESGSGRRSEQRGDERRTRAGGVAGRDSDREARLRHDRSSAEPVSGRQRHEPPPACGGHLPPQAEGWARRGEPRSGERLAPPPWSVEDRLATEGHLLWRLPLPGATRDALDLVRRGDELVVDVAAFRRIIPLTSALRRCTVSGAALRDGVLQVRFTPDPQQWPEKPREQGPA